MRRYTEHVGLWFTPEQMATVDKACDRMGMTRSALIRDMAMQLAEALLESGMNVKRATKEAEREAFGRALEAVNERL